MEIGIFELNEWGTRSGQGPSPKVSQAKNPRFRDKGRGFTTDLRRFSTILSPPFPSLLSGNKSTLVGLHDSGKSRGKIGNWRYVIGLVKSILADLALLPCLSPLILYYWIRWSLEKMDIRICFFPLPLQCQCDFCRSFKINLFELIRLEWKDQVGDELIGKDRKVC